MNYGKLFEAYKPNNFKVGDTYNHPKYGKFEVLELAKTQNTKVKFLEGKHKGDISFIAGWGADGYES